MSTPKFAHGALWTAIAVAGAAALGAIALNRGETINALWFVVAAVCTYLIGYRFYSGWIAARVCRLDATRATPAAGTAIVALRPSDPAAATAAPRAVASRTSTTETLPFPPASASALSSVSRVLPSSSSGCPRRPSSIAMARPMPDPAPLTTAAGRGSPESVIARILRIAISVGGEEKLVGTPGFEPGTP